MYLLVVDRKQIHRIIAANNSLPPKRWLEICVESPWVSISFVHAAEPEGSYFECLQQPLNTGVHKATHDIVPSHNKVRAQKSRGDYLF